MKKQVPRKLELNKVTVRLLTQGDLTLAAGRNGLPPLPPDTVTCTATNLCAPATDLCSLVSCSHAM